MNPKPLALVLPGVIMMIMMGTIYTWSVFRPYVETQHDLSVTQSGLPYMVSLVFYALSMMVSGRLMTARNTRMMAVMGSLFIGVGWLLASITTGLFALSIAYGVMVGIGVGMVYGVPIYLIQRMCPTRSGLYTGLVLLGFGMSPLFGAPLVERMLGIYGVATTFVGIGVVFLIGLSVCAVWLPRVTQHEAAEAMEAPPHNPMLFMSMYLLFALASAIGLMTIGLSYKVGVDYYGYDGRTMAWMVGLFAVCNGLARPLFGWLMDRRDFAFGATVSFGLIGVAALLAMINQGRSPVVFMLSFGLLWFNLGAWLAMVPAALKRAFGLSGYTRTYGVMFTAYGFGALGGVWLSGAMLEVTERTHSVYMAVLTVAIMALGMLAISTRHVLKSS